MTIISVKEVSRRFGDIEALRGVSLSVAAGQRVALLGHNGAGKSTLMKIVLGLIRADTGVVEIAGKPPGSANTRSKVAYLPENVSFHPVLTAREQLTLFARMKGASARVVPDILDRVGLGEAARRRVGTFSKGMRQRLGLAQILIGQPSAVILDEPTSGLDPISRGVFYDIVGQLSEHGAAILHSSHALTEVEARTDRIVIMRNGRLVADGGLADLRARTRLPIRLRVKANDPALGVLVDRLGGTRVNGTSVELTCAIEDKVKRLAEVTSLTHGIEDVDVFPPTLEEIYRHYSGTGRGEHDQ